MPENFAGPLRRFAPDFILLVDATRGGSQPAEIRWVEMDEIGGVSAFTHGLPLSVQAEYLKNELGCQVGLLGITGASFNFGEPLSSPVYRAVNRIGQFLADLFT